MAGQRHHGELTSLQAHDHVTAFGDGPADLGATAVAVFDAGRATGDLLLLVADDPDPALVAALPGRDALLAAGRLRLVATAEAYPHGDPVRLLENFDATLQAALAEGYGGIRVVADNTTVARGSDGTFAEWLAWEQTTARWQWANPVVGVCWFDRTALTPARAAQLAAVHPVHHGSTPATPYRLSAGDFGVQLVGDVDQRDVRSLVRLLALAPHDGELVVDVSRTGFVHHTVFPALLYSAVEADRIRLVGAPPALRRTWDAVGDRSGRVHVG